MLTAAFADGKEARRKGLEWMVSAQEAARGHWVKNGQTHSVLEPAEAQEIAEAPALWLGN